MRTTVASAVTDDASNVMIDGSVRVDIELSEGRGRQRCRGPAFDNLCPRVAPDGRVPCAGGRILLLHGTWADGAWLDADAGAGPVCPMACLVTIAPRPWGSD